MEMLQVRGGHLLTPIVMDGNELVASFIQQHGYSNVYNRSLPVQLAQGYAACSMKILGILLGLVRINRR